MRLTKAFTLVELLIATAVIAILSTSVVAISVTTNLQRSRDSQRKTNLEFVRTALEQYRADNGGQYPNVGYSSLSTSLNPYVNSTNFPNDPTSGSTYFYVATANVSGRFTSYLLCAYMEQSGNANSACTGSRSCGSGHTCNYGTTQP